MASPGCGVPGGLICTGVTTPFRPGNLPGKTFFAKYLITLITESSLMPNKKQIPAEIKAIARSYISDAEVMLFGSRAKQTHSASSDYDILIITSLNIPVEQKTLLRTSIRKTLLSAGIRSDILIQSKTEIEKKRKLPGHFIRNILNEAILL